MRGLFLAIALCAAPLAACGTTDPIKTEQTVLDEKALYAAEAAFYGVNQAAAAAVGNGLLVTGTPRAVAIADHLETARKALVVARGAYAVGDAKSYGSTLVEIQGAIGSAWALISKEG